MSLQEKPLVCFNDSNKIIKNEPYPGAKDFESFHIYTKDTIIFYNNNLYRSRYVFKSEISFNINDWELIDVTEWGEIKGLLENQSDLNLELDRTNSELNNLQEDFNSWKGTGGYLSAYDFGTDTPSQDDLTNYALTQITNITDPVDIFNGTKIKNINNDHVWILTNTQNTTPVVFEWTDQGPDKIDAFTINKGGYIIGSDPETDGYGYIESVEGGKGKVIGINMVDYSTDEKIMPYKWVNGETIYRKVYIDLPFPVTSDVGINTLKIDDFSRFGRVITVFPSVYVPTDNRSYVLPNIGASGNVIIYYRDFVNDSINVEYRKVTNTVAQTMLVSLILEYIKP